MPPKHRNWFKINKQSIDSELNRDWEAAEHSRDQLLLEAEKRSLDAELSTDLATEVRFAFKARKRY